MDEVARFRRLAMLFEQARALPPAEQEAFLSQIRQDDIPLQEQLVELLQHHQEAGTESPLPGARQLTPAPPEPEHFPFAISPGIQIGSFRVLNEVGRGGMGIVYRALQAQPQREVALKIIRPGALTQEMVRRFDTETAVLARLNHPGIAHIIESGVHHAGLERFPYFVMEYINGPPISQFVAEGQLERSDLLELFAKVCDAVQHAHQKGVIHRDLKPGNILVNPDHEPKILDFGIARFTDADQHPTLLVTARGQLLGTLPYMSPEQLSGEAQIDTRSDVYALGVLLYELLTRRLPYELEGLSFAHGIRVICEEEPCALAATDRGLRGDLETMVRKAMDKNPERRYSAASDLAADVRRFLKDEPILARPATALYFLRKFARRHRRLVAALAASLLALVTGLVVAVWQSQRVLAEAQTSREVIKFMEDMLSSVRPEMARGETVTMREVVDRSSRELGSRFSDRPLVRAALHQTLGATYTAISEHQLAVDHYRQAIQLLDQYHGPNHALAMRARSSLSQVLKRNGQLDEAERLARATLTPATRLQGPHGPQTLALKTNLSSILQAQGKYEEALPIAADALQGYRNQYGDEHLNTLAAEGDYAVALLNSSHYEQAEEHFRRVLQAYQAFYGEGHPDVLLAWHNLAASVQRQGRVAEALRMSEKALQLSQRVLGEAHTRTLSTARNVAVARLLEGEHDAAETLARETVELCVGTYGHAHVEAIMSVEILVTILGMRQRLPEAEAIALELFGNVERAHGGTGEFVARAAWLLRELYDEWEKPEQRAEWESRHEAARSGAPIAPDAGQSPGATDAR